MGISDPICSNLHCKIGSEIPVRVFSKLVLASLKLTKPRKPQPLAPSWSLVLWRMASTLLLLLTATAASHSAAFVPAPPSTTALHSFQPLQGAALRRLEGNALAPPPPLRRALIARSAEEEGGGEKGRGGTGKDDVLRKLSQVDASRGPEPPPKSKEGALPEWLNPHTMPISRVVPVWLLLVARLNAAHLSGLAQATQRSVSLLFLPGPCAVRTLLLAPQHRSR